MCGRAGREERGENDRGERERKGGEKRRGKRRESSYLATHPFPATPLHFKCAAFPQFQM